MDDGMLINFIVFINEEKVNYFKILRYLFGK